ncbi:MAG: RNA 2'-phosphotransferase [Aristaeellaceae bacterium]
MAERIAQRVAEQGGRVYYVGGMVRDQLLGRENKDVDIEVHGVSAGALEDILDSLGQRLETGVSFGVYGLRHCDLDIAMPLKDPGASRGHRNIADDADPFSGTEKAARRRDFTMNALMEDVLTGEIIDHFGGQADLREGIVRHVNDASFAEDPLRVMRAARFAARYGFRVADETMALCGRMDLSSLARERVFGETEKALLESPRPSVYFETLRRMGQLHDWYPELEALTDVPQEPRFHPEGSVWNHTMLVLDQAALLRAQAKEPLALMLSALCHDLGKKEAQQDDHGRIRALGHEEAGVPLAEAFLSRITSEKRLHQYVTNMVLLHMRPNLLAAQKSGAKSCCHLFDRSVCPEDLLLLSRADALGRGFEQDYGPTEAYLQQMLARYQEIMARPFVQGADLIAAGFEPGQDFHQALAYAHKMRLAGVCKEDALRQTAAYLSTLRRKETHRQERSAPRGTEDASVHLSKAQENNSRFVSLILRHRPETIGITLDEHGWADVEQLIAGIRKTRPFDRAMLEEIVANNSKQRFSFSGDGTKIRANQGHSVPVDVELEAQEPPEVLFHGTGRKYVDSILKEGLLPRTRLYVHLSADRATAVQVGARHGRPVVLTVHAGQMRRDGYVFYRSVNGVWLTKAVPTAYLTSDDLPPADDASAPPSC